MKPKTLNYMSGYVPRFIDHELDLLLPELRAVVLDGPKGVGKTRTALERCVTVRELDDTAVAEVVRASPDLIASDPPPVLLDEWQQVPEVWNKVRRLVDDPTFSGSFILTGSAPTGSTHSGAARIATLRMRPLCLAERLGDPTPVSLAELLEGRAGTWSGSSSMTLEDYVDEIIMSGFPGLRGLGARAHTTQLKGYLERIATHDLVEHGHAVRRPETVMRWLRAYAASVATTTSWSKVREAAATQEDPAPAKTTTMRYSEHLTNLRILDPLAPWSPSFNHLSRLSQVPKHHLADPALAVRLLSVSKNSLLAGVRGSTRQVRDGALLGQLFESLVALTVRVAAQAAGAETFHLRTHGGDHEVDFVIETPEGILAIEVKLGSTTEPSNFKHLYWLRDLIGDRFLDGLVVTTGQTAFRDPKSGFGVVPLALLGR